VRFWDTSALVPLLLDQPATKRALELLEDDPEIVAWWGSPVECASAAARLRREDRLSLDDEERVLALLEHLAETWYEILPSADLRAGAARLLRLHSLRAADALQLSAARTWAGSAKRPELVTFDERLSKAARIEGFRVLPTDPDR
jgi:uncharacterized protein